MPRAMKWVGLALVALWSASASGAGQQPISPAQFYHQTGLTLVVASGAGGGYDVYSRVLATHMSDHLPGKPNILVENMPGAAGLVAANWAYNQAPKDGSQMVATYSALMDSNLLGNAKAHFDIRKFDWIGSIASSPLICVTWGTSPYHDIRQMIGKRVTASATGRTAKSATMPLVLKEALGVEFKVISGYSTDDATLALERGEVDAICGIGYSTLKASHPDWINDHRVHIIAQIGLERLPELVGVPNVLDLVQGRIRDILEYGAILEDMGRPYLAPPGTPADRLQALRSGFDATMKDPAFIADLDKRGLNVSPLDAAQMNGLIAKLYGFSPDIVQAVAKLDGVADE
jgi:tripartite-type tricarboxylate transporter receptor subunit TctC